MRMASGCQRSVLVNDGKAANDRCCTIVYTTPAPKGTLGSNGNAIRISGGPGRAAQSAMTGVSPRIPSASSTQSLPPPPSTNSVTSPATQSGVRASLPSSTSMGRSFTITSDSPVMSETLSVIDEHITDMNSPRTSYVNGNKRDTRGSVYSREQPSIRRSYIAGHETDEEERQTHTEDEVMSWTPARVAEYLEDHGVEKAHCEVFKEQEISGEVLLAMDQNSLFIKEFELGSVGRRLKTWHKIKALHEEVRQSASLRPARSASEYSTLLDGDEDNASSGADAGRNRSSTFGAPTLPRGLATVRSSATHSAMSHSAAPPVVNRENSGVSPLQSMTSMSRQENAYRPSAQGVRNLNHSRRHSSIDSTSTDGASRMGHRKHPSIERAWLPGQPTYANGKHRHGHTASTDSQFLGGRSQLLDTASPDDVDRGYFSSNEADSRNRRSVLVKRNSATSSPSKNDTEFTDGTHDPVTQMTRMEGVRKIMDLGFGGYRSTTSPTMHSKPTMAAHAPAMPPIVTKLEPNFKQSLSATASSSAKTLDNASDASSEKATPSPSGMNNGMFSSFSNARAKITGLRSISDAVTKDEKVMGPHAKPVTSPTRTESSTPSTENRSMDFNKSDKTSRTSTGSGGLMPPPPSTKRPKARTKKLTSAYTRGLEVKTPAEQMLTCDYAGWMKKKSSSLMTTWKPRLFILRGRRLSYYYSDEDTEEKGLIDISFHKVLPAHNETLTGFHATVTGAAANPSSPNYNTTPTIAEQDLRDHPARQGEEDDGLFIFKLVPPKAGLAKGVNFTKPTVHYFAVNSRQEGRLWMAALMKATIDRDDTGTVTTTYNQKTISLSKARARRERPPGLKDDIGNGLGIGIGEESEPISAAAGAESEIGIRAEDGSSIAPSTANDTDTDALTQQEREAIAAMATP